MPVKSLEEAVKIVTDRLNGLSASIWTRDLGTAMMFAKAVKAGTVRINSHYALDGHLEGKSAIMRYP